MNKEKKINYEIEVMQNKIHKYLKEFNSLADLYMKYKENINIEHYLNKYNKLNIVIKNNNNLILDENLVKYIEAMITNIQLAYGVPNLIIKTNFNEYKNIKKNYIYDPRMKEIYGKKLKTRIIYNKNLISNERNNIYINKKNNINTGLKNNINEVVMGIDIGGTNVKTVILNDREIIKKSINKIMISEEISSDILAKKIINIINDEKENNIKAIGISWPAPIINEKIVTPIKIQKIYDIEGLEKISELKNIIENEINIKTKILNDGAAGALAISKITKLKNTLCISLGYSVSAGFLSINGVLSTQMELCASILGYMDNNIKKVRDYISLKFGIINISEMLGINLKGNTNIEKAENFIKYSLIDNSESIKMVFVLIGVFLAEMIATNYIILNMKNVAIFGGLSKNNLITKSAEIWLKKKYRNMKINFINTQIDNQYVNALGAAHAAIDSLKVDNYENNT